MSDEATTDDPRTGAAPMAAQALEPPVGDDDHSLGPADAGVTIVWYGDYECPHCAAAFREVEWVRERVGPTIRCVYRHFPLDEIHPRARPAARAAEAAARQDGFWKLHFWLFRNQARLDDDTIVAAADGLGMDGARLRDDMAAPWTDEAVDAHVAAGRASGVRGTPTFFVNGAAHPDGYDSDTLMLAIDRALGFHP